MIKLKTKVEKGQWFINKYVEKGKQWPSPSTTLTRTQKRRKQRQKAIWKMWWTLEMLAQAKNVVRKEVHSPAQAHKPLHTQSANNKAYKIKSNQYKNET